MQALSQLSYGPVLLAAHHTGWFTLVEAFSASCRVHHPPLKVKEMQRANHVMPEAVNKKDPVSAGSSIVLMSGVPTGIRTPVATVKG